MTAALLGNLSEPDLNPLSYVIKNKGSNEIKLSPADIFAMFGYTDLYNNIKNDINELQNEHHALTSFGQLLQIVVPDNKLADYVYSAGNKGENEPVIIINEGKKEKTFDIQKIMRAFPDNIPHSDNKEFVLANVGTKNGPLDPQGPFKIIAYDAISEDKKQEYNKKKIALFASIQRHIDNH